MNTVVMRAMTVFVLLGAVLPNTLTAGHFAFLVTQAEAHVHADSGDHDHSGHNQTPAPATPDVQARDETLIAALNAAGLWEIFSTDSLVTDGNVTIPPAPPPRYL